ncbi:survival protein SurA precursor [alpha proteobacterium U9-1i]|nr:survival protein SurA precursor [alpha proteobacterium U9-1i]
MNWKSLSAAAVSLMAVSSALAPSAEAQFAEGVAAIVNDDVISTFDVRQRANLLLVSSGVQPSEEMSQRARTQALRDLIDEHIKIQETSTFDISISEAEVDRQIGDIARGNEMTIDQLASQLAGQGVSINSLRFQVQADIAWNRLVNGLYGSRIRVSDQEIRETQARIAANATRPQYLLSEIYLPAETEQEFTNMRNGAMQLLQEMQNGAPFPAVARQFSAAPSASQGGDIGWIAAPELAPELQPVAERLEEGQVSLPIRTSTGIVIIAMRDRRAGAAAGATSIVNLRQVTAPAARRNALERVQRRISGCTNIERDIASVEGANLVDLGQTTESELSGSIQSRISGIRAGDATPVVLDGEQATMIVVCSRETGGGEVPDRREIEQRLRGQELDMLAERYLRNLRSEATIITR